MLIAGTQTYYLLYVQEVGIVTYHIKCVTSSWTYSIKHTVSTKKLDCADITLS